MQENLIIRIVLKQRANSRWILPPLFLFKAVEKVDILKVYEQTGKIN